MVERGEALQLRLESNESRIAMLAATAETVTKNSQDCIHEIAKSQEEVQECLARVRWGIGTTF